MSPVLSARIRRFLKRFVAFTILSVLVLTLISYEIDFVVFRYRVAANRQAYGQVVVTSYDAVLQKNGKTEFLFNPPQAQTCVNTLFPRAGYLPCWYLQRHTEQRTNI